VPPTAWSDAQRPGPAGRPARLARIAVRTRLVSGRGGMAAGPGGARRAVICEARELRRVSMVMKHDH